MWLLHNLLEDSARRLPEKIALVAGGQRFTYAQIEADAARLASGLQARGVVHGDRVAIFADNGVELVVSIFAALKAGAVIMPVNSLTKGDKLAYLLNDSRAAAVVTTQLLRGIWEPAITHAPSVKACIVAGLPAGDGDGRLLSYEDALAGASLGPEPSLLIDQHLASIIYTSGSTGEPKGVMLTHLNMVSAARSVNGYLGMTGDDVIMCALPLAFDYGLYQILMGFMVGATVVLERSFSFPVKVLETMASEGVTVFPGVPTMFSMIMGLNNLSQFDLRRLRMITNTAAALSERHIQELRALFPQATLFSMYGLTECKRVTYLPPDQLHIRPTSVGRGMPNEEVWLVDEAGNRLPNGSTGELVIRGSNVMRGYWEKPEHTARRLKPGPNPGEMVLYSGDVFRTDEEGFLYFVARKDDIIKSRGEKVSPKEVENVLYGLDGVQDAAVVGVPDEILGQAIKAFVVLRPGCKYSEKDVIRHCQGRLESFMVPKHIAIVPELPKTDTGKIKKTGLA
ncbi:MAG: class I adenylate-forming enzyme family protein [Burkholderiales bacterium]